LIGQVSGLLIEWLKDDDFITFTAPSNSKNRNRNSPNAPNFPSSVLESQLKAATGA
jgi:hypothetical protein